MKPIDNLHDLFVELLIARYDAETQQTETFPTLIGKATSTKLKQVLKISFEHSQSHLKQLEYISRLLHFDIVGEISESAYGIFHETWQLINRCTKPEVTDAVITTAVQMIHHNDIAGYGTLAAFARTLELDDIARAVHDILVEEKVNDELLTEVAKHGINRRASEKSL